MAAQQIHTEQPVWKFWTKMNRQLTDADGNPAGALKMSVTRSVTLLDTDGNTVLRGKPTIGMGFTQELLDADGKSHGLLRKKPVKVKGLLKGSVKLWVIEQGDDTVMFLQSRRKKDLQPRLIKTDVALRDSGKTVWEIVKGSKSIAMIVHNTGLTEQDDLLLEDGVSKEDQNLATMIFGYKIHKLLK